MQFRINAIIAYKVGGWSSYTAVLDETTRAPIQEFPNNDPIEAAELASWEPYIETMKKLSSTISLSPSIDISHISDITFNIASMGDTKTDIFSANEDTAISTKAKHDDLVSYVEQPFYRTNPVIDLDTLFLCWDFSGPDGPLTLDQEDTLPLPQFDRTGIKETNNRGGFLWAAGMIRVNNKLRLTRDAAGSIEHSIIYMPFAYGQTDFTKLNIARGVGFTARIDVLAMSGGTFLIGATYVPYEMYFWINHTNNTLDIVRSNGFGSTAATVEITDVGFPSTYKLNAVWKLNGDLIVAIDDTIVQTINAGTCWVAGNTEFGLNFGMVTPAPTVVEQVDLDQVMIIDTDSITELNSLVGCPTRPICTTIVNEEQNKVSERCVEYGPLTPPVPTLQLTISGLGEGFTFLGLGNGVHNVTPAYIEYGIYDLWSYYTTAAGAGDVFHMTRGSMTTPQTYSSMNFFGGNMGTPLGASAGSYGINISLRGSSASVSITSTNDGTGASYNIPRVTQYRMTTTTTALPLRTFNTIPKIFGSVKFSNDVTISWQPEGTSWFT